MSDTLQYLTRRQFSVASLGTLASLSRLTGAEAGTMPWSGPALVRKVYLASQKPSWPRPDIDLPAEIAEIEANLAQVEKRNPGAVRFTGGELLREGADISAWIQGAGDADVILAFNLTSGLGAILQKIQEPHRPVLLFSRPYAGHSWSNFAGFAQKGAKADVIASSEFSDLDEYLPLFRTIHVMRNSKVLLVAPSSRGRGGAPYTEQFGTSFGYPDYSDLKAAFQAVDLNKARAAAAEFTRAAVKVVEPSSEDITASLRLYLGMKEFLQKEKANAIAIDCLGGFNRGDLPAYPCVGFAKLNDAGLYGVCECDLNSTMTQILVTSFSGKPGFVSDPVFDTSRNEVIHAHCVAATRMEGIGAAPSPFIVRSHLEDNKGVSLQVLMPPSGTVTVGRFQGASSFMVSTGEVLGNVDAPRGCRSKIRTRVSNARKFLEGYGSGLHRVVFYGDHTLAINRLSRLNGFKVVEEV